MFDFQIIIPFIIVCLVVEITPGPNMVYLALLSLSRGYKAGLAGAIGASTGLLIIGIMSAFGVSALISGSTTLFQVLRWAGVFYLLWLAWEGWREEHFAPGEPSAETIEYFKRGLFTNLLNPKAAIFYISVLPGFIKQSGHMATSAIFLTFVYVLIATMIHLTIVLLSGHVHRFLTHSRRNLVIRRILSIALVLIALWLAWITRTASG